MKKGDQKGLWKFLKSNREKIKQVKGRGEHSLFKE